MNKVSIFCLTLEPSHEELIKRLSYIPVGLGDKKFSKGFFSDKMDLASLRKTQVTVNIRFIIGCGKII